MNWKQIHENFEKERTGKSVIVQLKCQWELDEVLFGKLVKIVVVHFDRNDNDVNGYIFETDNGLEQTILGAVVDSQAKETMIIGNVYACKFKGKIEISGERTLNRFDIIDYGKVDDGKNTKSETTDSGQTGKKH